MPTRKAYSVYLFTNRNCMVFDKAGKQIAKYQRAITCYTVDKKLARQLAREAKEFHISDFREWTHPIPRYSFEYLLGLRSSRIDRADMRAKRGPYAEIRMPKVLLP